MLRNILLLDHDDDDIYVIRSAFKELAIDIRLDVVGSQDELIKYLDSCVQNQSELPSIILLNYGTLPVNSLEVVKLLKSNQLFSSIPIVVGCGVVNDKIVRACYAEGVSSFLKKADTSEGVKRSIQSFIGYWRQVVLPQN